MAQYSHTNSKGVTYYLLLQSQNYVAVKNSEFTTSASLIQTQGETLDLPADRKVEENPRNGFLVLKKK